MTLKVDAVIAHAVPGDTFADVASNAYDFVQMSRMPVQFEFNDVLVFMKPNLQRGIEIAKLANLLKEESK